MIYESTHKQSTGEVSMIADPDTPVQELHDYLQDRYFVEIDSGDQIRFWAETECTPPTFIFSPANAGLQVNKFTNEKE